MLVTTLTITAALFMGFPAQDAVQADPHARHSHDGSDPYGVFLDHTAPAICTVTFILDVRGGGGQMDREVPMTATGTIVSSDGLIMMSSAAMDMATRGGQWMRRGRGGRGGGEGRDMDIEATPTDIRIMLGGDFEEHDAELVAKDSTMGLAFLKVTDPTPLSNVEHVTFDTPDRMRVGEELIGISRLSERYDYEAYLGWLKLSGRVDQPRRMWTVSSGYNGRGLPLFNRFGQAVGVLTTSQRSDDAGEGGRGGRMMGGGGGGGGAERVFLIPSADVNAVIEQARKKVADAEEAADAAQQVTATESE
ncbi:MAG: serine protease [Phycisphaerales bacterium]|nr:serine protease [Phycisphaerales bacterium]